jgi:hypothetical protein
VEKKDEDEPAKKQAVSVLDPKRAQNTCTLTTHSPTHPLAHSPTAVPTDHRSHPHTAIMLARFKMPYADLRKAIEDLDETILTVDNLTSLKQCIPTPDEIAALKEIEGTRTLTRARATTTATATTAC